MPTPSKMLLKYFYTSGTSHMKVNTTPYVIEITNPKRQFTLAKITNLLQENDVDTSKIDSYKYYSDDKGGYIKMHHDRTYLSQSVVTLFLHLKEEKDIDDDLDIDDDNQLMISPLCSSSSFRFDISRQTANEFQPDLIYLYASPIVKKMMYSSRFSDFNEQIDYQGEIEKIVDSINQAKKNFTAIFEPCDLDTFTEAIRTVPKILHISCHGIIREKDNIKKFSLCMENKGVLIEITEEKIRSILSNEERLCNIDLVFISACHSEYLGNIFFECGVKNVICVNKMTKISDYAAQVFSSTIYQFLVNGDSVCDAFDKSKKIFRDVSLQGELQECCCNHEHTDICVYKNLTKRLQSTFHKMYHIKQCMCSYPEYHTHKIECKYIKNQLNVLPCIKFENDTLVKICCCSPEIPHNESSKFILLSNEGYRHYIIFPALPSGRVVICNTNCFMKFSMYRKKKIKFIGRNMELKKLMDFLEVENKHFILIYGPKGLGKKSFAKFASIYLFERKIIEDVFFIEIVTLFYSFDMVLNKIEEISNNTKSNKILILIFFPAILEEILFKSINEILNELMKLYSQFYFCFLIDTNFDTTKFENEFNKGDTVAKLPLKPLYYDNAESLFYSLIPERQILTSSEIDNILKETKKYPTDIFFIASMIRNAKHPEKVKEYLAERRKNFDKVKNEIITSSNYNNIKGKILFLLSTMPKGLNKTQLNLIDDKYENEAEENNIIISRYKKKLDQNWYSIETTLISQVLIVTKEDVKIECIRQSFMMFAKFFMSYICSLQPKRIVKFWNSFSHSISLFDFCALKHEGIWKSFNQNVYQSLFTSSSIVSSTLSPLQYLKKHRYNIEYLIENNKKTIYDLLSNANDEIFIECFEQTLLLLPSIFKYRNRSNEAKEILRQYISLYAEFKMHNDQERLRLFLLSFGYNCEFSPKDIFPYNNCYQGKAEAYMLKAMMCFEHGDAFEDVINNYIEAMKIFEHIQDIVKYANVLYRIGNIYQQHLKFNVQARAFFDKCIAICGKSRGNDDERLALDVVYIKCNVSMAKIEDDEQNYENGLIYASNAYKRALSMNENGAEFIITSCKKLLNEIKQKNNYTITLISSNSLLNANGAQVFACANTATFIAQSLYEKIKKKIRIKTILLTMTNLIDVLQSSGDILILQSDDYTEKGEIVVENDDGKSEVISNEKMQSIIKENHIDMIAYKLVLFGYTNSSLILPIFSKCNIQYAISFDKFNTVAFTPLAIMSYNILLCAFIVHFVENLMTDAIDIAFAKAKNTFINRLNRIDEFSSVLNIRINNEDVQYVRLTKRDNDINNEIFDFVIERTKLKEGNIQFNRPILPSSLPVSSKRLICKNVEMYSLIKMINENKIVNLWGMSGVGKTALGIEVAKFFHRHGKFKNGIYFFVEHKLKILKLSDFVKSVIAQSSNKIDDMLIIIDRIDKSISKAKKQKIKFIDKVNSKINILLISRKIIQSNGIINYQLVNASNEKENESKSGKKSKKNKKSKKINNSSSNSNSNSGKDTLSLKKENSSTSSINFLTLKFDLDESDLSFYSHTNSNVIHRNESSISNFAAIDDGTSSIASDDNSNDDDI